MSVQEMSKSNQDILRRATAAVKAARDQLESWKKSRSEPIAIVGLGCRFPGSVYGAESYWNLLCSGTDTVRATPEDRFVGGSPVEADRSSLIRFGAFLDDVAGFDAGFFGISPREARQLDPQQRIFLEVACEAIEDAGLPHEALRGSNTGVFLGVVNSDYLHMQLLEPALADIYTINGGVHCMIANRLSYLLDLQGPSLAIDTACSGSLVAVHLACQSLRSGESDLALAGGVNLILSAHATHAYVKAYPLAPDGRCRTFDARADGYVRGEGCGVVVLKRLSDAIRDKDAIWALIRGSAVNQDGRTNGLTAPNGLAQERVIRRALQDAGLAPSRVSCIEAHGTGTKLGDPIEVEALRNVYSAGDSSREQNARPCALGSVKTNLGHLEAAAGVAGLIKLALCLKHREIPAHLHFQEANPEVPLAGSRFFVPGERMPWRSEGGTRVGAVSAFGAGGTNAHVVLEEYDAPEPSIPTEEVSATYSLPLSGKTRDALLAQAASYREFLATHPSPLPAVCASAAQRRTQHEQRAVVIARTKSEMGERLSRFISGVQDPCVVSGGVGVESRKVVFVFSGQGSQWLGMGRALLEREPVFRQTIQDCEAALREFVSWSLVEQITSSDASALDDITVLQPALWAMQVALARLWQSWGASPDAVLGHSMGEVAAAVVANALSLQDGARIICKRSELARTIRGGGMLFVAESVDKLEAALGEFRDSVAVAAENGPVSTVLSGAASSIDALHARLTASNVFCRRIRVDFASHSPQTAPLMAPLRAELESVSPRAGSIPIQSTLRGQLLTGSEMDANYWAEHLRQRVRFLEGMRALLNAGHEVFIEVSPHPILTTPMIEAAEFEGKTVAALATLHRDRQVEESLALARAQLHVLGLSSRALGERQTPVAHERLPRYVWQHRPYWFKERPAAGQSIPSLDRLPVATAPQDAVNPSRANQTNVSQGGAGAVGSLRLRWQSARADRRAALLEDSVLSEVASALGADPENVERDAGFFQMGMDSIVAVRLHLRISELLGLTLATRVVFEYPSVSKLSHYLHARLSNDSRPGDLERSAGESVGDNRGKSSGLKVPDSPTVALSSPAAPSASSGRKATLTLDEGDLLRSLAMELAELETNATV
ncbi:MAG TPA: type I polyketide synthase [Polyangiaceae bacterium]|nr:type I polyketide synthase [Polyangiaceae bacterium]